MLVSNILPALSEPLTYRSQPAPVLDAPNTEDGDYNNAQLYINNEDVEMEQADTEMEELEDQTPGISNSPATSIFEVAEVCLPLQDILMGDAVQSTDFNIDSAALLAFEVQHTWNSLPV